MSIDAAFRSVEWSVVSFAIGQALVVPAPADADWVGPTGFSVEAGAPDGYTTYRVYMVFDDPQDQLWAISSDPQGNPLYFETNVTLLNDGGPLAGFKQEDFAMQPISEAWDSYVTIDREEAAGNDTTYSAGFLGGDGIHAVIVGGTWQMEDPGAWYDTDPTSPALAGEDLRVLVAQFTVEQEPNGYSYVTLLGNVQWQAASGGLVSQPFSFSTNPSFGACCYPNGGCDTTFSGACIAFGGEFQGEGTTCDDFACEGACCLPDGSCLEASTPLGCAQVGGSFRGHGTVCAPGLCSCPGDVDADGEVGFADLLLVLGSWGACAGCPEDVDEDGVVGFLDLLAILADWGACP